MDSRPSDRTHARIATAIVALLAFAAGCEGQIRDGERDAGFSDAVDVVGSDTTSPTDAIVTTPDADVASPIDAVPSIDVATTDVITDDAVTSDVPVTPGDVPPTGCPALTGPFGTHAGDIADPSLTMQGYAPGDTAPRTIRLGDFYDCDGTRGINAIAITETSAWCGSCYADATDMNGLMTTTWNGLGVAGIWLLFEDTLGSPASIETVRGYREGLHLDQLQVIADPAGTFRGTGAVIASTIIDPRTMRIVDHYDGYNPGGNPAVAMLANMNHR